MISFQKYHGLGNDFIIVREQDVDKLEYSHLAIKLCSRHQGIGADGLIIVKENPLTMIFFNKDGTEAPMCGNGIRCFAHFLYRNNILLDSSYPVNTKSGVIDINVIDYIGFKVCINMGLVKLNPEDIPVDFVGSCVINEPLYVDNKSFRISSLFLGTTHTVIIVDNIDVDMEKDGALICNHPSFPQRTNVNFVEILDSSNIRVRTYERGVGVTHACGTGACASAFICNYLGMCSTNVNVHLDYGVLHINLGSTVLMTGPSCFVYEGVFYEEI